MKIGVTTAGGNLGSTIIKKLIDRVDPENIIGIARDPENTDCYGVEVRKGDYNSRSEFDEALKGIDTLILITTMSDPNQRIIQHRNIIGAAKKCKVRKIVFSSIIGDEDKTTFGPLVDSYRQTEEDIKASGLEWAIGRNGLYIEPDLDYIDTYIKEGKISNCAGEGKCAYTSRSELAEAHIKLLLDDSLNGDMYQLVGDSVSQWDLVRAINKVYNTDLTYQTIPLEEFRFDRRNALGNMIGDIVAGIYHGINMGIFNTHSDFEKVTGRAHQSLEDMIRKYKSQ